MSILLMTYASTVLAHVARTHIKHLGHWVIVWTLADDVDIEREHRALSVRGNMLAHRFARCTPQLLFIFIA